MRPYPPTAARPKPTESHSLPVLLDVHSRLRDLSNSREAWPVVPLRAALLFRVLAERDATSPAAAKSALDLAGCSEVGPLSKLAEVASLLAGVMAAHTPEIVLRRVVGKPNTNHSYWLEVMP